MKESVDHIERRAHQIGANKAFEQAADIASTALRSTEAQKNEGK